MRYSTRWTHRSGSDAQRSPPLRPSAGPSSGPRPPAVDRRTVTAETGACHDERGAAAGRTGTRPQAGPRPCPADSTVGLRPGSGRTIRAARCEQPRRRGPVRVPEGRGATPRRRPLRRAAADRLREGGRAAGSGHDLDPASDDVGRDRRREVGVVDGDVLQDGADDLVLNPIAGVPGQSVSARTPRSTGRRW
jgi:hypothetical protein